MTIFGDRTWPVPAGGAAAASAAAVAVAAAVAGVALYFATDRVVRKRRVPQLGAGETGEHQDAARAGVGATAYVVAMCRALETVRGDREPLVRDEPTRRLFALCNSAVDLRARLLFAAARLVLRVRPVFARSKLNRLLDLVALRSRYLDDCLLASLRAERSGPGAGSAQLVIVGSGLDARGYRLRKELGERDIAVFEVDFAGMLAAKSRLFASAGCPLPAGVALVGTDLSLPDREWVADLRAAGFDASLPTTWLMEGFTAYLTADELRPLLAAIAGCSAPGSAMLATWIGFASAPSDVAGTSRLNMHKLWTEKPHEEYMAADGWRAKEVMTIGAIAKRYLAVADPRGIRPGDASYRIAWHTMPPRE